MRIKEADLVNLAVKGILHCGIRSGLKVNWFFYFLWWKEWINLKETSHLKSFYQCHFSGPQCHSAVGFSQFEKMLFFFPTASPKLETVLSSIFPLSQYFLIWVWNFNQVWRKFVHVVVTASNWGSWWIVVFYLGQRKAKVDAYSSPFSQLIHTDLSFLVCLFASCLPLGPHPNQNNKHSLKKGIGTDKCSFQ